MPAIRALSTFAHLLFVEILTAIGIFLRCCKTYPLKNGSTNPGLDENYFFSFLNQLVW
jgi:hypothetical protein